MHEAAAADFLDDLRRGTAMERFGGDAAGGVAGAVVHVRVDDGAPTPGPDDVEALAGLPLVVVVSGGGWGDLADIAFDDITVEHNAVDDIALGPDRGLADVVATVEAAPRAATALAMLLRGRPTGGAGLAAESAVYSLLQAGPEFAAWRREHPARAVGDGGAARVRVERDGDRLDVTLTRAARRNALDARMRDELVEALGVAGLDDTVERVVLAGEGPSFCSGGDLDEFGSRPDPATAHLVRLERSPARSLLGLTGRVTARVHGPCAGSGVELPAFASHVVADPDTTFRLPEVRLGLVPGAGGTVSLPRRIGRHRTAWLALTGRSIDAATAAEWGLVDEVAPVSP